MQVTCTSEGNKKSNRNFEEKTLLRDASVARFFGCSQVCASLLQNRTRSTLICWWSLRYDRVEENISAGIIPKNLRGVEGVDRGMKNRNPRKPHRWYLPDSCRKFQDASSIRRPARIDNTRDLEGRGLVPLTLALRFMIQVYPAPVSQFLNKPLRSSSYSQNF